MQRDILDSYANAGELRRKVSAIFSEWRAVGDKLDQLSQNEQEKLRMLDLSSAFATATTTPFLPDHHINKVGHRIVGDALVPWAVEVCRAHAVATAATPRAP